MIREATLADLDAISEVEAASFKKGAWPKKAIEAEFKENELSRILVDEEDGKVVAWLDFMITFTSATVMAIGVKPEYRKRGIATSLMKKMEEICRAQEETVEWITLEVRESNEEAIALYKKLGYVYVTKKVAYYEDGEDALYLIRSLIS